MILSTLFQLYWFAYFWNVLCWRNNDVESWWRVREHEHWSHYNSKMTHLHNFGVLLWKWLEQKVLVLVRVHFVILGTLFVETHNFNSICVRIVSQLLQSVVYCEVLARVSKLRNKSSTTFPYRWPIVKKCLMGFISFLSAVMFGMTLVARPLEPYRAKWLTYESPELTSTHR